MMAKGKRPSNQKPNINKIPQTPKFRARRNKMVLFVVLESVQSSRHSQNYDFPACIRKANTTCREQLVYERFL